MSVEPTRCEACAGSGWKNGVKFSTICDAGCAGSGIKLVIIQKEISR